MSGNKPTKPSEPRGGLLTAVPLILAFLGAIIAANAAVFRWGQAALPFTALILIPFDMLTRDILHARWSEKGLWKRMFALVLAGSVLTYLMNRNAAAIAFASTAAFASCTICNTVVYELCKPAEKWFKMGISSIFAALVDSLVFPYLAFDTISAGLCIAQFVTKSLGVIATIKIYLDLTYEPDLD